MSSFSRFQDLNKKRIVANQDTNASFVFNAYNTTTLTQSGNTEQPQTITASVVNLQEKDMAYIYTMLNTPLEVGSIWGAKGLHWLIEEEIITIKDVKWHKYLAFLCNLEIDGIWGYFIGPKKTFVRVNVEKKAILESQQHPILVSPAGTLSVGQRIMAGGRAWLVQEVDNLSTFGIDYYSLVQTTMAKVIDKTSGELIPQSDGTIEDKNYLTPNYVIEATLIDGIYYIAPNQEITLTTEQGFFKTSNSQIKIKKHTATQVIFTIPFGITEEIEITFKQNNEEVTATFKAVE